MDQVTLAQRHQKTTFAFFWMYLANEPFVALFTLLGFILKKELGASTFQLSLFAALNPVLSFFSFYWSTSLDRSRKDLLWNLMGAWILARLPFLLLPCFPSIGYLIVASSFYQLFNRASAPALMEILKQNMQKKERESLFSSVYILSFLESVLLGLFIGKCLDAKPNAWKWAFFFGALLSMTSLFFQKRIPIQKHPEPASSSLPYSNKWIQPWKDCLYLMKTYPDFATFQWGFMIGGFGLMIINPALIIFYSETLNLSHENLTTARYLWMGAGILLSSHLWKKGLSKDSLNSLILRIIIGFGLFPLVILSASVFPLCFYLAFFLYGISQAGSHLVWHLSGTLFASENESSSKYTGTNLLMVGIRGLIGPLLGGVLTTLIGASATLLIGASCCLAGALFIGAKSLHANKRDLKEKL